MAKLFRRTPEDNQGLFQHRTQSCHAATADSLRVQAGQCSGPRLGRRSHRLWSLGSAEDNSGSRDPEPKRLPDAQQRSDPLDDAQRNQRAAKGDRRTEEPNTAVAISFTPARQQAPSLSARFERINKNLGWMAYRHPGPYPHNFETPEKLASAQSGPAASFHSRLAIKYSKLLLNRLFHEQLLLRRPFSIVRRAALHSLAYHSRLRNARPSAVLPALSAGQYYMSSLEYISHVLYRARSK